MYRIVRIVLHSLRNVVHYRFNTPFIWHQFGVSILWHCLKVETTPNKHIGPSCTYVPLTYLPTLAYIE